MTDAAPGPYDPARLDELVELTRTLGDPWRDLVILAEGNTSVDLGDGTMLVKASGSRMPEARHGDFVRVRTAELAAVADGPELDDDVLGGSLLEARVEGGPRPSIEAILHALCIEEFGAHVVGHTHPIAANQLLCSDQAERLAEGILFPDQAVVCGPGAALAPYADPGVALARSVRDAIRESADRLGEPPRTVWLANHGLFALGHSAAEVLAVTEMAVKTARVLSGVLAVGQPRWLDHKNVLRLVGRADEKDRRRQLVLRDQQERP